MRQGNSFEMVQEHNDEIQAIQARVKRNGFMPKNDRLVLSATSTSSGANLTGLAFKNTGLSDMIPDQITDLHYVPNLRHSLAKNSSLISVPRSNFSISRPV